MGFAKRVLALPLDTNISADISMEKKDYLLAGALTAVLPLSIGLHVFDKKLHKLY